MDFIKCRRTTAILKEFSCKAIHISFPFLYCAKFIKLDQKLTQLNSGNYIQMYPMLEQILGVQELTYLSIASI